MEKIDSSRKILSTKMSYISNIMIYYGYVHEWAELYRQLWRDSRKEWDKNANIIVKVILKNKNFRCKMEFKKDFSNKQSKYLLQNNTYNYYWIGVSLWSFQSIKSFTSFIESIDQYSSDLFYSVSIWYIESNHDCINNLLVKYFEKNFKSEAIEFTHANIITKELKFLDKINFNKFIESTCKMCHILTLVPQNLFKPNIANIEESWLKLKEMHFHTLNITFDQLSNLICYFESLNDKDSNIPINSEGCKKIYINDCNDSCIESHYDSL